MATITQLYNYAQLKQLTVIIVVAGVQVVSYARPAVDNMGGPGTVPSATFDILHPLPAGVVLGATVKIFWGFNDLTAPAFSGKIQNIKDGPVVDTVECVGESDLLRQTWRRTIVTLASVQARVALANLFDGAGVTNYFINVADWLIGSVSPGILDFESYGDAVNEIAQVDASPFIEMPDGQVRVELRDPIPSSSSFRVYYSGQLQRLDAAQRLALQHGTLSIEDIQPDEVLALNDPILLPRLRTVSVDSRYSDVKNQIIVQGAVITSVGTNGTSTSERLESPVVQGLSPYIPVPPSYQQLTVDRPLIDDIDKITRDAIREYALNARLQRIGTAVIDGDPEMFVGCTVFIADPDYSGEVNRFFVTGYRTSVSDNDFVTELAIAGGAAAGTTPSVAPYAAFTWGVTGKVTQVLPVGIGPGGTGVVVTFDGTASRDFDGEIASFAWLDALGNAGTGPFFSAAYDPAVHSTVDVTLTVTDNDGLTGTITKTVTVQGDDSNKGGQVTVPTFIFCAAEEFAMGSKDGGVTWNDIGRAAAGVTGKFIACSAMHWGQPGGSQGFGAVCLFVTDLGEAFVSTDCCVTGFKPIYAQGGGIFTFGVSSKFSIVPVFSPSTACWLVAHEDGNLGVIQLVWFAPPFGAADEDIIPPTATGWLSTYINGLFPQGPQIAIEQIITQPPPEQWWPALQDQIRNNL